MNKFIEDKIKEFKKAIFWSVEGENETKDIVSEARKMLEDCQKQTREEILNTDNDLKMSIWREGYIKGIEDTEKKQKKILLKQ